LRLAELGVEKSAVKDLFAYVQVEGMNLVSADPKTGEIKKTERQSEIRAVVVPLVLTMLTYLLLLIGSTPLLQSVMEEKSQRIAEVLLGCVKPFQFMLGKVLGGVGVSITASAVYFGVALVLLLSMGVANLVPFNVLPWFMVYLLVAVVMMGAVFATLGSLCSEPKHAQALTLPAMLPVMLPMFALGPLMKAPHSAFGTVLSFLPPCTPMVMVFRQCTSAGVPAWQPWAALLGMVLTTILAVWIGGRVFRVGLLLHGGLPKLADMARWAIKG
jgi:ABC-2 type transport system permease protein